MWTNLLMRCLALLIIPACLPCSILAIVQISKQANPDRPTSARVYLSAERHLNLARSYKKQYLYIKAVEECKRAIKLKPNFTQAYLELAELYFLQSRYTQAVMAYKNAIQYEPNLVDAYLGMGASYERLAKYPNAIGIWKRVLTLRPNDLEVAQTVYVNLASAYKEIGDSDSTIEAYRQLIDIQKRLKKEKPDSIALTPDFWAEQMAELYEKMGRHNEAIESYKLAVSLASSDTAVNWAYSDLAALYGRLGKYEEAVEIYRRLIATYPDWPEGHFELGRIYIKTGDRQSALREHEILKRLNREKADSLLQEINK